MPTGWLCSKAGDIGVVSPALSPAPTGLNWKEQFARSAASATGELFVAN